MARQADFVRALLLLSTISQLVSSSSRKATVPFDFYLERDGEQVSVFWKGASLPKVDGVNEPRGLLRHFASSSDANRKVIFYLCQATTENNAKSFNLDECQQLATINKIQEEGQTSIFSFKSANAVEIINQQFSVESSGEELIRVTVLESPVPPRRKVGLNINISRSSAGVTLTQFIEAQDFPFKIVNFWLTDSERQVNRFTPLTSIFVPKTDSSYFNIDIAPLFNKFKEWGWENSKDFTVSSTRSNGEATDVDFIKDDGEDEAHLFMINLNDNVTIKLTLDADFLIGDDEPNLTKQNRLYIALHIDTPNNIEKNPIRIETFSTRKDRHYGYEFTRNCGSAYASPCIKLNDKNFFEMGVTTLKESINLGLPSEYVVFTYKVESDPNFLDVIQVVHGGQGACDFQERKDSYSIRRINILDYLNDSTCKVEFIFKSKFTVLDSRFGPRPSTQKHYADDEDFAPTQVFLEIGTGDPSAVTVLQGSIVRNNVRQIQFDGRQAAGIM